jgi:hypothetical protein
MDYINTNGNPPLPNPAHRRLQCYKAALNSDHMKVQ